MKPTAGAIVSTAARRELLRMVAEVVVGVVVVSVPLIIGGLFFATAAALAPGAPAALWAFGGLAFGPATGIALVWWGAEVDRTAEAYATSWLDYDDDEDTGAVGDAWAEHMPPAMGSAYSSERQVPLRARRSRRK